jgi:NADH:ubiquinone oxidoreductase subunit E
MEKKKKGSVVIVGAGIAGTQAAITLGDAGYKVYLVEKSPSIGGVMTQLDKTFPTNDCSMCILSPKLVECSRHANIKVYTNADIEEIAGELGNFTIKIKKRARYVDDEKCTGCGICTVSCPVTNHVQVPETLTEVETEETIAADKIIDKYGAKKQALIMILQDANEYFNYLPEIVIKRISKRLGISYAEVYGVISFYKSFSLEARGQHTIQVCMGTACHVRGAQLILEELERILGIEEGQTTEDRLFTLETVNCLGACALGPIISVDGEFHGNMTLSGVSKLIDKLK